MICSEPPVCQRGDPRGASGSFNGTPAMCGRIASTAPNTGRWYGQRVVGAAGSHAPLATSGPVRRTASLRSWSSVSLDIRRTSRCHSTAAGLTGSGRRFASRLLTTGVEQVLRSALGARRLLGARNAISGDALVNPVDVVGGSLAPMAVEDEGRGRTDRALPPIGDARDRSQMVQSSWPATSPRRPARPLTDSLEPLPQLGAVQRRNERSLPSSPNVRRTTQPTRRPAFGCSIATHTIAAHLRPLPARRAHVPGREHLSAAPRSHCSTSEALIPPRLCLGGGISYTLPPPSARTHCSRSFPTGSISWLEPAPAYTLWTPTPGRRGM
ncbi:hypothetical protein SAMN05421671_4961 [Pimelobacter simplex]|nr:hypothetical protein SAMN05421671_4961 [Pimelobacter simplex]